MDPPIDEVAVLSGFSVTWDRRPHRIRVLGVDIEGTEVRGGAWADGDRAIDVSLTEVDAVGIGGRPFAEGTVRLTVDGSGAIWARRRELGHAATTFTVDGVGEGDVAVWITGFRFATDPQHPDGYTLHTLSVALGLPVVHDGVARVPLEVGFGGGAVPDRAQALGSYGAEVEVSWAAVPCAPGEVEQQTVERAIRLAPIAAGRHRDAERVTTEVAWTVGPEPVVALSGFRVDIHDGLFDGRYARSLLVRVAATDDPQRSEVSLGFDNAGPLARAVRVELGVDLTALAPRPTDAIWTRSTVEEPEAARRVKRTAR